MDTYPFRKTIHRLPDTNDEARIRQIVEAQRRFFRTGTTLPVSWRIRQLKKLKAAVIEHEKELVEALQEDLGRTYTEAYLCDIGPIIVEINEMLGGLRRWARPERHFSGLMCFPSLMTKVYKMPYGVSLVISPFNFPILLTIGVVAAAMCGGNTVVIKSSSKSASSTAALKKFFAEVFPLGVVRVSHGAGVCCARGVAVGLRRGAEAQIPGACQEAASGPPACAGSFRRRPETGDGQDGAHKRRVEDSPRESRNQVGGRLWLGRR